eukprot:8239392-Pyramimonas_sp.AAC.1
MYTQRGSGGGLEGVLLTDPGLSLRHVGHHGLLDLVLLRALVLGRAPVVCFARWRRGGQQVSGSSDRASGRGARA